MPLFCVSEHKAGQTNNYFYANKRMNKTNLKVKN